MDEFGPKVDAIHMKILVKVARVVVEDKSHPSSIFGGFVRDWIAMCFKKMYDPFDVDSVDRAITNGDLKESEFVTDLDIFCEFGTWAFSYGTQILTDVGFEILKISKTGNYREACKGHRFFVREPMTQRILHFDFVQHPTAYNCVTDFDVNSLVYSAKDGIQAFFNVEVPLPDSMFAKSEKHHTIASIEFFQKILRKQDAIMASIERKECSFVFDFKKKFRDFEPNGRKSLAYRVIKMLKKGYKILNIPTVRFIPLEASMCTKCKKDHCEKIEFFCHFSIGGERVEKSHAMLCIDCATNHLAEECVGERGIISMVCPGPTCRISYEVKGLYSRAIMSVLDPKYTESLGPEICVCENCPRPIQDISDSDIGI